MGSFSIHFFNILQGFFGGQIRLQTKLRRPSFFQLRVLQAEVHIWLSVFIHTYFDSVVQHFCLASLFFAAAWVAAPGCSSSFHFQGYTLHFESVSDDFIIVLLYREMRLVWISPVLLSPLCRHAVGAKALTYEDMKAQNSRSDAWLLTYPHLCHIFLPMIPDWTVSCIFVLLKCACKCFHYCFPRHCLSLLPWIFKFGVVVYLSLLLPNVLLHAMVEWLFFGQVSHCPPLFFSNTSQNSYLQLAFFLFTRYRRAKVIFRPRELTGSWMYKKI